MVISTAADRTKRWLSRAARELRTADPVAHLAPFLDESLGPPPGSQVYRRPHAFETRFSERTPRHLELGMSVGDPLGPPQARVDGATRAMRHVVHHSFGPQALRWLDGRTDSLRHENGEAWVTSGFDGDGVRQAEVTYAWGPRTGESLTMPIYEAVQRAIDAMPALEPALTSVRCGRSFGNQQITFRVDGTIRLADLRGLMDAFGLGAQHNRLVNMLAFVLGARFTLPPHCALITLRPTPAGIEMRIDVDLEAIPDVPRNIASLLQLQLVERPQSLAALDRWMTAMTPEGQLTPGGLSVLSVVVRPELGPRLAIDLRPSVIADPDTASETPPTPVAPMPRPVRRHPEPVVSTPVAGTGYRSPWDPR